jgi:choline dehydrogenase-like flavoprotein
MLSRSWSAHRVHYDFLIIGSGYGGAIAAARLATAKLSPRPSICVLERGSILWSPSGTRLGYGNNAIREVPIRVLG